MPWKIGPWGPRPVAPDAPPADAGEDAAAPMREAQLACAQCGAVLAYAPGTNELACTYCGHVNPIREVATEIVEHCLDTALRDGLGSAPIEETRTVKCGSCAAEFTFDPATHAGSCPFCGHSIVTNTGAHRQIKPAALLPFLLTEREARDKVKAWLSGLWFAPTKLKTYARSEGRLAGVYLPYWTFDSRTRTRYQGRRGDYYSVPMQVRTRVNGRMVTQTRQVQKVRWRPASGEVRRFFDDVLVLASRSLPTWMTDRLEPWDLIGLKPYTPEYVAGFQAEAYQHGLEESFDVAARKMREVIAMDVRSAIGGDVQEVHRMDIEHSDRRFKHVLLPCWLGAYLFGGKSYHLCVNARTGQVQGERPYSWIKIAVAVCFGLIVAAIALAIFAGTQ
jgi:DNA-directed RNA polymerase subunit RPC12/RpoP